MSDELLIIKRATFIKKVFNDSIVEADGINISARCVNPSCSTRHKKDKKKLSIRVDNEVYHCWVCGFRGKGLPRLLKKYKPRFYKESISLFEKYVKIEDDIEEKVCLPDGFQLLAEIEKSADPDIKACLRYLASRGITKELMWYFKIGAVNNGSLRRRVIMPSFDSLGNLNYYTARAIDENNRKYINPKVKRTEIIYNELNIDWSDELLIVEGPFDLMKSTQNATCLLGSTLSKNHLLFRKIVENHTSVVLALDPDAAQKVQKICKLLYSYDISIKILEIDGYDDIGDMPLGMLQELLQQARPWTPNEGLLSLIDTIKSGSLI